VLTGGGGRGVCCRRGAVASGGQRQRGAVPRWAGNKAASIVGGAAADGRRVWRLGERGARRRHGTARGSVAVQDNIAVRDDDGGRTMLHFCPKDFLGNSSFFFSGLRMGRGGAVPALYTPGPLVPVGITNRD
jgi:hypothetical protein